MKTISLATSFCVHLTAAAVALWLDAPGRLELIPPQSGLASIELTASMAEQPSPAPREIEIQITPSRPDVSPPRRDKTAVETDRDEPVPLLAMAVQVVVPPRAEAADVPNLETGAPELPRKPPRNEEAGDAPHTASVSSPASARSQGVQAEIPPRPQFNPEPIYPRAALLRRITGRVVLRVRVAADGSVEAASMYRTSGHDSLDQAALAAVRRWRFVPARNFGLPVAQEIAVPIVFELR